LRLSIFANFSKPPIKPIENHISLADKGNVGGGGG